MALNLLLNQMAPSGSVSVFCAGSAFFIDFALIGELGRAERTVLVPEGENNPPSSVFFSVHYRAIRLAYKGRELVDRRAKEKAVTLETRPKRKGEIQIDDCPSKYDYIGLLCEPDQRATYTQNLFQRAKKVGDKFDWQLEDLYSIELDRQSRKDCFAIRNKHPEYFVVYKRKHRPESLQDRMHELVDAFLNEFDNTGDVCLIPLSPRLLTPEFSLPHVLAKQTNERMASSTVDDKGFCNATQGIFHALYEQDGDRAQEPEIHMPIDKNIFLFAVSKLGKMPLVGRVVRGFLEHSHPCNMSQSVDKYDVLFINFKQFKSYEGSDPVADYPSCFKDDPLALARSINYLEDKDETPSYKVLVARPADIIHHAKDPRVADARVIYTEIFAPRDYVSASDLQKNSADLVAIVDALLEVKTDKGRGLLVVLDEFTSFVSLGDAEMNATQASLGKLFTKVRDAWGGLGVRLFCIGQILSSLNLRNVLAESGFDLKDFVKNSVTIVGAQTHNRGNQPADFDSFYASLIQPFLATYTDGMQRLQVTNLDALHKLHYSINIDPANADGSLTKLGPFILVPPVGLGHPIPCHILRTRIVKLQGDDAWESF